MASCCALALTSVLIVTSIVHAGAPGPSEKLLVYNDITEGAGAIDRDAKQAYVGKFRFIAHTKQRRLGDYAQQRSITFPRHFPFSGWTGDDPRWVFGSIEPVDGEHKVACDKF